MQFFDVSMEAWLTISVITNMATITYAYMLWDENRMLHNMVKKQTKLIGSMMDSLMEKEEGENRDGK